MANFTWEFDAPSGVYKSHEMSAKLRHAAISNTKFMQFVTPEPGFGRKAGEAITITRVSNLTVPSNPRLTEGRRISEDELTLTTVAITVSEFGRAVPYTNLAAELGKFDKSSMIQRVLRDQMALSMDNTVAEAFTGTSAKYKAIPTGVSAITFDTDGTASTQALANLNVYHVEQIRDTMFSTLKIPPVVQDDYIAIVSTKAKRGLVTDPAWERWHTYTDPQAKFNGEIGRLEGIRFVESNNTDALSGSLGSGSVLGEAVFFGADAVAMVSAVDPELRAAIPGDFGRQRAIAWYGVLEFGVVWDTANAGEAKIVHVTSS